MHGIKFINPLMGNLSFKLPGHLFATIAGFMVAVKLLVCDVFQN